MNSSCMRETRGRGGREGEGTYYSSCTHNNGGSERFSVPTPLPALSHCEREEQGWGRRRAGLGAGGWADMERAVT